MVSGKCVSINKQKFGDKKNLAWIKFKFQQERTGSRAKEKCRKLVQTPWGDAVISTVHTWEPHNQVTKTNPQEMFMFMILDWSARIANLGWCYPQATDWTYLAAVLAAASRSPCGWPVFAWAYWVMIKLEVLICFLIGNILSLPYCARVCYSVYEKCLPPYKNNVPHKETHTGLYCMAFKNNVIGWMWATVQQFCKGSFEMYYKRHSLWVETSLSRNVHSLSDLLSIQAARTVHLRSRKQQCSGMFAL